MGDRMPGLARTVYGVMDRPDRRGQHVEPVQLLAQLGGVPRPRRADRVVGRGRQPVQPYPQERLVPATPIAAVGGGIPVSSLASIRKLTRCARQRA